MALHPRPQGFCPPRLAAVLAFAIALLVAVPAQAARTVYLADPGADAIAQYSVGPGGVTAALDPVAVAADGPRRMAMTRSGAHLYAAADHGVLQYDVAADGRLTPKTVPIVWAGGDLRSIAVHPDDASVYVTDAYWNKVRQFDVGADGSLTEKTAFQVPAGPGTRGIAVSPNGLRAYVLVDSGIVVFDVGAGGALVRRTQVAVPSLALDDVALTPNGANLYATSGDGRVFQFDVAADGSLTAKAPESVATAPGSAPVGLAVAPTGTAVYVAANSPSPALASVTGFVVGADGRLSAGGSADVTAAGQRLWYLSASPDGKSLFAAGADAHLFDLGAAAAIAPKAAPRLDLDSAVGVVVSPNQPPVASFATAAPGIAGTPIVFDASGAADPDGTIARYDWDFGDGTALLDGGPNPRHTYTGPGSYTVVLVVTDNEGASTTTIFTGGTALGNGEPVAQASQVIQIAPPAPAQTPLPDLGETLVADPVVGRVLVQLPGAQAFVRLSDVRELPLGSVLDTRRGRVEVATERRKRGGRVQRGRFFGGLFLVRQRKRDRYVTELVLRGELSGCTQSRSQASAAARKKKRKLWGNGSGRFRTRGRYSSGAVRGTKWVVVDRCDGTLTLVRRGEVTVRDFGLDRGITLRAGERYLARPR